MSNTPLNPSDDVRDNWLEVVRQHVESLRFGAVEIIVQDSRVIQIEKTERLRLEKGGSVQLPASSGPGVGSKIPKRP